jgi:hypothetical protein
MKLLLPAALLFATATLRADYTTHFSSASYVPDQTILGTDGWNPRLLSEKSQPDTMRVVAVRWNAYKQALMMKGANLKATFEPTKGERVKIIFDVAFTFPDGGQLRPFRIGFIGAPCGEFFFDSGPEGGLGCQSDGSGRGGMVVLKKSELKTNAFYTITVAVDYAKLTYDLNITGQKKDGSPFQHGVEQVPFESKAKSVGSLYVIASNAVTAYLGSVQVLSEPPR